ncbi:DNA/RNA helicase domain-containing protein [Aquipuribacter sp. MA13-6]|uniref:DNA/RNA helicase domain-containing protein n=1 Tax=unclassified Aquipuribacter TaxID=2635084 RepID=UPI003EEC2170
MSEQRSWRASLPVLAQDLMQAGLPEVELLIEYQLPLTSRRADVVLAGSHPKTGQASYVVVELKQWTAANAFEGDDNLVEVPGAPGPARTHPVRQVAGYVDYLTDYLTVLADQPDALVGVAYLHNATDPLKVADLHRTPGSSRGRLFTGADRGAFHEFLRSRLAAGTRGGAHGDRFLSSTVAPSKQLLKVAADEVRDREQFRLIGDQQLAVDHVLHAVEESRRANHKRVVVVSGGPGSGKSVIALSLLGELSRGDRTVLHATGSRSFTQTLRKVAGRRAPRVQSMFKYFNQFMDAGANELDVLILDEAHRIRESSVNRYTPAAQRTGRPQIDELLDAARVPVFLLDQHQVVRPGEMGSREVLDSFAEKRGLDVVHITLDDQFRCGGSREYVTWVQQLLGLSDGAPQPWAGDERFEVIVADAPEEMEQILRTRMDEGYSARMSAGYCWPWSDPTPAGTLVPDVRIDGWSRPWNVKGDRRVGDAPPSALWATEDGGFEQVGCIYTAQGFEYDWSGVIVGPDLLWRDGRFVSDRAANRDPEFRNRNRVSDAGFDRLVRNTYKVLLTRGMQGTVLYSTDARTRAALRRLVAGPVD